MEVTTEMSTPENEEKRERETLIRAGLMSLETALRWASEEVVALALEQTVEEREGELLLDAVQDFVGEAQRLTQHLHSKLIPKVETPVISLFWGPTMADLIKAGKARAKAQGVECYIWDGDTWYWEGRAVHLMTCGDFEEADMLAIDFRCSTDAHGKLILCVESNTSPPGVTAFDEALRFPENARS